MTHYCATGQHRATKPMPIEVAAVSDRLPDVFSHDTHGFVRPLGSAAGNEFVP
jgi:hypothetical protein